MSDFGNVPRLPQPSWDPRGRAPRAVRQAWNDQPPMAYKPPRVIERPRYREPLAIRPARLVSGFVGGLLWMSLAGAQTMSLGAYGWASIAAAILAWIVALVLVRVGDRGVAVGIAISSSFGLSVATVMIVMRWSGSGWPLW